jgi:hypothetical protein
LVHSAFFIGSFDNGRSSVQSGEWRFSPVFPKTHPAIGHLSVSDPGNVQEPRPRSKSGFSLLGDRR